jgi:hypothetical protein
LIKPNKLSILFVVWFPSVTIIHTSFQFIRAFIIIIWNSTSKGGGALAQLPGMVQGMGNFYFTDFGGVFSKSREAQGYVRELHLIRL